MDPHAETAPSQWVERWASAIRPGGEVLDVASGSGRHARFLARLGFEVDAVDRDAAAFGDPAPGVRLVEADIEAGPWPYAGRRFDAIVVTNYLHRPLLPVLVASLEPGGLLIYETFARGNERFGKPSNPAFLLAPGELLEAVRGRLRVVAYEDRVVDDPQLEWKFCAAAIPAALALAIFFHWLMPGLQRIVFGMPVHELGHAVSAWLCGYFAIPTLWKTLIPESRGFVVPLALAAGIAIGIYRAWMADRPLYVVLLVALAAMQGFCTLVISGESAEMLFTFGGDGLGMVIAAALMASFFVGKRTQLYRGSVRWGLLVIGAAAFVDMYATWWMAQWNADLIAFGENEGSGLSDPLKLVEEYGWSTSTLVRRYVVVGAATLAALAAVYVWGVRRALRKARVTARVTG